MENNIFSRVNPIDLDRWANKDEAASEFPRLIRMLCKKSGALNFCDFHSNEENNRHGVDGRTSCSFRNTYIPYGETYWELGTGKEVEVKAEKDYKKGLENIDLATRQNSSFVFATPRIWSKRNQWKAKKDKKNEWKEVRVYDANDICKWAEEKIYTQTHLQTIIGNKIDGVEDLRISWEKCNPPLDGSMFRDDVSLYRDKILNWVRTKRYRYLTIRADSSLEALAFLYLVTYTKEREKVFPPLMLITQQDVPIEILVEDGIIPIATSEQIGKNICSVNKQFIAIQIMELSQDFPDDRKNENVIRLSKLRDDDMRRVAEKYNKDANVVILKARGSRTYLRENLTDNPYIKRERKTRHALVGQTQRGKGGASMSQEELTGFIPCGKGEEKRKNEEDVTRLLIPIMLNGGTFLTNNEYHRKIFKILLNFDIEDYINKIEEFIGQSNFPLWIERNLFLIGLDKVEETLETVANKRILTKSDFKNFSLAFLSILPMNEGSERGYSSFKADIYQTILFLIVKKDDIFQYLRSEIEDLSLTCKRLLFQMTPETFLATNGKSCHYVAEAWPDEFLSYIENIIERDDIGIWNKENQLLTLEIRYSIRRGLELIAVHPTYFERAAKALSKMFQITRDEVFFQSLRCLFIVEYRQTNALDRDRVKILLHNILSVEITERLCEEEVYDNSMVVLSNYHARYRQGKWRVSEKRERTVGYVQKYRDKIYEICLKAACNNIEKLTKILKNILKFNDAQRKKIWAMLRETCCDMDKFQRYDCWKVTQDLIATIREIKNKNDRAIDFIKNARKFANELKEEIDYFSIGVWFAYSTERRFFLRRYGPQERRLKQRQEGAIRNLSRKDVHTLLPMLGGYDIDYNALAKAVKNVFTKRELLRCLKEIIESEHDPILNQLVIGILCAHRGEEYISLFLEMREEVSEVEYLKLLLLDGWREEKIDLIKSLSAINRRTFWEEITPSSIIRFSKSEEYMLFKMYKVNRFNDIIEIVAEPLRYFKISKKGADIVLNSLTQLCDRLGKEETPSSIEQEHVVHVLNYFEKEGMTANLYSLECKLLPYVSWGNYQFSEIKKHLMLYPAELFSWLSTDSISNEDYSYINRMRHIIYAPPSILLNMPDGKNLPEWIDSIQNDKAINFTQAKHYVVRLIAAALVKEDRQDWIMEAAGAIEPLLGYPESKKDFSNGVVFDAYGVMELCECPLSVRYYRIAERLDKLAATTRAECPRLSAFLDGLHTSFTHAAEQEKVREHAEEWRRAR